MDLLSVHGGLIGWTIITFIVLLVVLKATAWPSILGALDEREKAIRESLKAAEKAKEDAVRISKEYEEMINKARHEAQEIINAGKSTAEKMKSEILAEAQTKSQNIIAKAKTEIEQEREKAKEEIRGVVVELTINTASKLISKVLDPKDHLALINQSIDEIKIGKVNEN
ncbi:F0F1 ATP synthase subunit B [bacterium]|nr:F0F1 ATP synthase subunit B [bacterium]